MVWPVMLGIRDQQCPPLQWLQPTVTTQNTGDGDQLVARVFSANLENKHFPLMRNELSL
jgi:hypothetical protein